MCSLIRTGRSLQVSVMYEPIDYRTYLLNAKEKRILMIGLAGTSLVLAVLFFDHLIPAVFGIFLYPVVRKEAEKLLGERRKKALRNQFRDFLFSVSASFASGRHMTESMEEALKELNRLYPADAPIVKVRRRSRSPYGFQSQG